MSKETLISDSLLLPFYYMRHGETDWNIEGRSMGNQDIPLNAKGVHQAEKARIFLKNQNIKTICYSPLTRAKKTAEIVNEVLMCPMIEIDSLKEVCWGVKEGQLKGNREHYNRWVEGDTPVGAEPYSVFLKRIVEGLKEALSYPNTLIVSHGGVLWAILREFFGDDSYHPGMSNCTPVYLTLSSQKTMSRITLLREEDYVEPYDS